jgi:signal transduction histidine kinase/DNA-binding response OmpR family regulator
MSDKATILAVDDTSESLALLVNILTPAGYQVHPADSGELALAAVAVKMPDLILLDVRMAGIDGFEVCRRLKAHEETRHIPIILISAFADTKEWVEGIKLGAADYITKPFQTDELLMRVRTHLALGRAHRSLDQQAGALSQTNARLQSEVVERRRVEEQLRHSLEQAERSRRAMLGTMEDQKRAEDELRFGNLILSTQQEVSIDGILVVGIDGKIISSNRRFAEMWGIPLDIIESKSDERALKSLMDKLANPEEFISKVQYLYATPGEKSREEIALKDGRIFDRYSAPMIGAAGDNFGRVWFFRDITAGKQSEKLREDLQAQLRGAQKMEAIGSLAGGVAHDFNNLLSVILNYTGFAMDDLLESDPRRHDLLEVKKAGEQAAVLTRQLLAFGRKQVLQPVPLNLNQITEGVEKMLGRILGEDISLIWKRAPDLGMTSADPGQIEQVLMNLVVNARDAMPEGGELTIETANVEIDEAYTGCHVAVAPGAYVFLSVTDTGCGMDAQVKARLFEPFFTTKQKEKGTGLGLSTVYGIVKQSGGNINLYSEPGLGTTFKIYLPRELDAAAAVARRPSTVAGRSTGDETILLVEDEEALLKVSERILKAAGYTVLSAANGNEALLTCARHTGDLHCLLTDVVMPRMGGGKLAEALLETRPTLKVLYMSGYTDDTIIHHGVLDAGTHFLGKPFTATDLTQKVREVLDSGITGLDLADGHEQAAEADNETKERPLDKDALRAISPDVLRKLRRAMIAARHDELIELIETIRYTQPDVTIALRRMADLFDYDGIRGLLSWSSKGEEQNGS